jgi:hypothetical protein
MAETMTHGATGTAAPDRPALRARLEAARAGIRQLIASISEDQWDLKSGNAAWTCGQLATHLADTSGLIMLIERARKGKGFNLPMFLVNTVNIFRTRRNARNVTRDSLLAGFDADTERWLDLFDATSDAELPISVKVFGEQVTVAGLFERLPGHLEEHGPDIRSAIGQG